MRTKSCRKLKTAVCESASPVTITENGDVVIGCNWIGFYQEDKLARDDGFNNFQEFLDFFRKTHGLPFYGFLIRW